uniref:Collagen alpha-1(I) chain-like n=1 Tax=Tursiops truncatus TaxID=9739 RepID=A0A6J3RI15_TURTR|nr:collagen alpha-1(I) chain-like [Tursiops truncatus]
MAPRNPQPLHQGVAPQTQTGRLRGALFRTQKLGAAGPAGRGRPGGRRHPRLSQGPAGGAGRGARCAPRGVPGPPWVTGSSGGAGSGAGLEAEARGVSVTSWGTEGLPRSAELEAGVGAEAGGTGPKDVFWAVTGGVEGPPSRTGPYPGISRWVGGLGASVPWVSGASGPAEEEARGARGRGPSSAGSGLTSCGSRAASAGPCAGPALAPTPERRLPWGPLRRAAGEGMRGEGGGPRCAARGFSAPGPAHPSQTGRSKEGLLTPPGAAWARSTAQLGSEGVFPSVSQARPSSPHLRDCTTSLGSPGPGAASPMVQFKEEG